MPKTESITLPAMPCPLWLRGDCPSPQNPEKHCHLWQSGECRPGPKGECQDEIREGEKQFGKVNAPKRDPYLMHINYLDNDGGMRADVGDSGLMAHPALESSPYADGHNATDSPAPTQSVQAVAAAEEAYRLQNVPQNVPRPVFNPKPNH